MEVAQLLDSRDPVGSKRTGKPAAMGTEDMVLVESFSSFWQLTFKGPPWLVLLCCLEQQALEGTPLARVLLHCSAHQALKGPPSPGFFSVAELLALVCGLREAAATAPSPACDSAVLPGLHGCSAFLQRHSSLRSPHSMPSGCLLVVNS